MAVYSTDLILASVATGTSAYFESPTGYVTVVRSVHAAGTGGASGEMILEVNGIAVKALAIVPVGSGEASAADFEGRLVLPSEATLAVLVNTPVGVLVSGYLLSA